jgi:hypothetical protein
LIQVIAVSRVTSSAEEQFGMRIFTISTPPHRTRATELIH